ncbi:MAG TPA: hypothetical protein VNQ99_01445 [Xanthobacteraceae bacterium]|nr:hypothetical protein [Xanthobacteraceae bacterium]
MSQQQSPLEQRIILVDLRIPFVRLVMFFVKAALAAIPAAIIVTLIGMLLSALIYAVFGGGNYLMMQRWQF